MSTNEEERNYQQYDQLEERIKNAEPRYLTEGKKRYLLASSQESLQALQENQKAELTRVLISLKSEHDQLTLETNKIQNMLDEYDKRIAMIQSADETSKIAEDKQKKDFEFMDNGISSKKERKNEEEFTKKSLLKQKEKLNKDILIIQKEIIQYENESQNLDKKMERAAINENIIKEKKNKVYSKTENQKQKNRYNQNENDLKLKQYKKMIELKSVFLKFSDERKEIQNQIAQQAKNDSLDKQEVEKRKTLKLLMLYNQYLRTLMDEELKENEGLENIFEQIRDVCGTKNLDEIVDFIMLRNKRYNYACHEINVCEKKNKKLKNDIKMLKSDLIELKNNLLVEEKEGKGREVDVEVSTNPEEEMGIIEKEKEKNKNLLLLGKKYNEVEEAYQLVLQNLSAMVENEKQNPLDVKVEEDTNGEEGEEGENEEKNEIEQLELTSDELKKIDGVQFNRNERNELDKYTVNEQEELIAKNAELTDKDIEEIKKNELNELKKIIIKDEENTKLSDDEKEIIQEILNVEITEDDRKKVKEIKLTEDEEKVALLPLKTDNKDLSIEDKKRKIENFKELKIKYKKYKIQEKKDNTLYKIKKSKKNKVDLIKDYNLLLKKLSKKFDTLEIMQNKQAFLNYMEQKGLAENNDVVRSKVRKTTKKGTRKATKRLPTNKRILKTENYKIVEDKDEEDDKSNYDPDVKILNRFLKEQKKEKENFISGKIKIPEEKK
jgi:hypothetical protein